MEKQATHTRQSDRCQKLVDFLWIGIGHNLKSALMGSDGDLTSALLSISQREEEFISIVLTKNISLGSLAEDLLVSLQPS